MTERLHLDDSYVLDFEARVLACREAGDGLALAELDLADLGRIRTKLPSLANRRSDAYRWPGSVESHA